MPNWCEGNIRFRGKQENIKRFLMNEIVYCKMVDHETVEEKPTIKDDGYMMLISKPEQSWFYIKNTIRNLFDCSHGCFCFTITSNWLFIASYKIVSVYDIYFIFI